MAQAPESSPAAGPGRPAAGFGHYLRDVVYGALDGVITTLAVVAGASGAQLGPRVAIILGLANLVADGISMGASNYLGLKSELQQAGRAVEVEAPWRHGLATLAAFVVVGSLPLFGYVLGPVCGLGHLPAAAGLGVVALLLAGAVRAPFVNRRLTVSAAEMLAVGTCAAGAAYAVGRLADQWLR